MRCTIPLCSSPCPQVLDRVGIYEALQVLPYEEQRQLSVRMGFWHIWSTLASRPYNYHFHLDIKQQEQVGEGGSWAGGKEGARWVGPAISFPS